MFQYKVFMWLHSCSCVVASSCLVLEWFLGRALHAESPRIITQRNMSQGHEKISYRVHTISVQSVGERNEYMRPIGSDMSLEISPKSIAQRRKKRRYWFSKTDNNFKKLYYITKIFSFYNNKVNFFFISQNNKH